MQTEPVLPVLFRVARGELFAYFPTLSWCDGQITCYARVGQHGGACPRYIASGRAARPDEYADLLAELRGIYERSYAPGDPIIPLRVLRRAPSRYRRSPRYLWQ